MHELSIAQNIVDIVQRNIARNDLEKVKAVRLKIGQLAGVVSDSLRFSFTAIVSDSPLRNAFLEIEETPFVLHCNGCERDSTNEIGYTYCPNCGSRDTTVISGTEMLVREIELADSVSEHSFS